VEQEAPAVEKHFLDARRLRPLGDGGPDLRGRLEVVAADDAQRRLEARRRGEGAALRVVDHLRRDVLERAVHRQPRLLARHLPEPVADALAALREQLELLHRHRAPLTSSCLPCGR
jgi:hypothetical protein